MSDGAAGLSTSKTPFSTQNAWSVAVLTVVMMFSFLDRQVMALLITPIKRDLHLSDTQVSLLVGFTFVVFYVGVGVPLSRLVDRGSRKWIISAGLAFWSVMTTACGLAQNFWQLAAARMGVGVGESCNTPATYSLIADMFPREQLARAISVINLGNVGGQGLAFLVGGSVILWLTNTPLDHLPLVGHLAPWQLTFVLLGVPGIIWALVMVFTVPEPPRKKDASGAFESPTIKDVVRFVGKWWRIYFCLIVGITIKAMLSFGTAVWAPAFFERQFGWKTGEPGLYLGAISLIVMPVGLLLGGWLTDRRTKQGHDDANVRWLAIATVALLPFTILFPLMPTAELALFMLGATLFFGALGVSPGNAAIQLITPGRMRGTVTAFYIAVMNILGYGAGPLMVALFTDHVFRNEAMLAQSMAVVAGLLAPIGTILCWLALKAYMPAVKAAREREA